MSRTKINCLAGCVRVMGARTFLLRVREMRGEKPVVKQ